MKRRLCCSSPPFVHAPTPSRGRPHNSVALAAAAVRAAVYAHEKTGRQKAEYYHSSSDPGPEHKALLDGKPNSNTPRPTNQGDVVPVWYSFDLVNKQVEEGGKGLVRMEQSFLSSPRNETSLRMARWCSLSGSRTPP
jgi:hypothetical protein